MNTTMKLPVVGRTSEDLMIPSIHKWCKLIYIVYVNK